MTNPTGDKSTPPSDHEALTSYLRLYEIFHNYIMRELGLINNRLTWMLTIHGFLYAVYGLTLQKQLEILNSDSFATSSKMCSPTPVLYALAGSEAFLLIISLVGCSISLSGYFSINAACDAMDGISSLFSAHNVSSSENAGMKFDGKTLEFYKKLDIVLPHLLGGGSKIDNNRGNKASKKIPLTLLASWLFSFANIAITCYVNRSLYCNFPELTSFIGSFKGIHE